MHAYIYIYIYIYILYILYYAFFISNTRMKLAKNQAKSKQHPVAEHLLFETCLLSLSTLSSKNDSNKYILKNVRKLSTAV